MRRVAAVAGVYLAAAVLLTWPLTTGLTTRLGAPESVGDPYLNLWILGWGIRAWQHDPWGTLAGRAFDAPIFHPSELTLTYSDHQLLQALLVAPVEVASGNLTLAYNVVLLGSLAASGMAMHGLARAVTGSTFGAFLAGLAWACWPYRTAQLLHLHLQALYLMPVVLWALTRVAAGRRWRDAGLLGLSGGLQAVASASYGMMTAVVLVVVAPLLAWTTGQWRASRYWTRVFGAGALAALVVLPVASPYLRSQAAGAFERSPDEASNQAASLQSYMQVPPDNLLYGRTGLLVPRPSATGQQGRRHVGHQMFPGLVLIGLACWGLWVGWRSDARALTFAAAALVLAGVWLSLGPEGPGGVYRFAAGGLPGFDAIGAPARFGVVAMLGAALLAALGLSRIVTADPRRGRVLAGVLLVAMLVEYVNAPQAFVEAPAVDTPVGRWLRDAPEPGAVLYLPIDLDRENTPYMIEALQHRRPIVNGFSHQRPSAYTGIVAALATLPGAEGQAMLKELGVRFVVTPRAWATAGPASPFVERARFGDRVIYEVRGTPGNAVALDDAWAGLPPRPGRAPFSPGEEATYVVHWVGDLPAGQITVRARRPEAADRERWPMAAWRFEATAETAEWASRFFAIRDAFVTLAADDLSPVVQTRNVDEGARQRTRAYVYDAGEGEVRVADTVGDALARDAPASTLVAGARDALGAIFYVRTQSLVRGLEVAVPINDGGQSLMAFVRVDGSEIVTTARGPVDTVRLSVALDRRFDPRQAIAGTIWLSADAHRVPVRLDVAAGFGRLRVELVDYRP